MRQITTNADLKAAAEAGELTALQWLYLSNTQVSDLSPLSGLTALQKLYLSNTQVSDASMIPDGCTIYR